MQPKILFKSRRTCITPVSYTHLETDYDINDPALKELATEELYDQLIDEIELLDGASDPLDLEQVQKGELSPVFFGSALTTFGVETFLKYFLEMTTSPLPRMSNEGEIDPLTNDFSAFVFKIQANMNKAHRDRIAFLRICSGKFQADKEVYHVQSCLLYTSSWFINLIHSLPIFQFS